MREKILPFGLPLDRDEAKSLIDLNRKFKRGGPMRGGAAFSIRLARELGLLSL